MEILLLVLIVLILLVGARPIRRLLGGCLSASLVLLIGLVLLVGATMIFSQVAAT